MTVRHPTILHLRNGSEAASPQVARTYLFEVRPVRRRLRHMSFGIAALGLGFSLALMVNPLLPL
jgi:hypothetical protein